MLKQTRFLASVFPSMLHMSLIPSLWWNRQKSWSRSPKPHIAVGGEAGDPRNPAESLAEHLSFHSFLAGAMRSLNFSNEDALLVNLGVIEILEGLFSHLFVGVGLQGFFDRNYLIERSVVLDAALRGPCSGRGFHHGRLKNRPRVDRNPAVPAADSTNSSSGLLSNRLPFLSSLVGLRKSRPNSVPSFPASRLGRSANPY